MSKSRHTEPQIIVALKQVEAGRTTDEVARESDEALRNKMMELAQEKPRYGYRRLHVLLQREGQAVNHKRCYRIYREAGCACGGRSGNTVCG